MVINGQGRVSLAFTVGRGKTDGTLRREEAEYYAFLELKRAGIPAPCSMEIEAYENAGGWLIFCTVRKQECTYLRFDREDDFLDAVGAVGLADVTARGWRAPSGYIVRLQGPRAEVQILTARLREYGSAFEAPPAYEIHLDEQFV